MVIYDYLTQIKLFLINPELQQVQPSYSVPAELVMRFRQATLWSVLNSKRFLAQVSLTQQTQCVDLAEKIAIERTNEAFLRDLLKMTQLSAHFLSQFAKRWVKRLTHGISRELKN